MPSHRHLPISPEWIPFELAIEHAPFWRFVFLSMLLHTLAILMFGAPSGGSREGRAMWGTLQAVLAPPPAARIEAPIPASPEASPTVIPEAGVIPDATRPVIPDAPKGATIRDPVSESAEPPFSFPPLLDRLPAPDIKLEALPPLRIPPPTEVQAPPAAPVPAPLPHPLPSVPAPLLQPLPSVPAPLLLPLPSVPESTALPTFDRVPEIRAPAEAPPIPAPLLQPLPSMPERGAVLPPIERAPVIQAPIERGPVAPETARPATPDARQPSTPDAARPATPDSARPVAPEAPAGPTVRDPTARAPLSPDSLFKRRDEPASNLDPTRPALDPDALRKRAGELAREGAGQRALLPFPMPPVEKPKSKLESAIENARKPDCRDAYKALGLAAVVPLIANEFGEGSCRW